MNLTANADRLINKPPNVRKVMFDDGDFNDIIKVIRHADKYAAEDTERFAQVFSPDYRGMKNIWKFVKQNIRYIEDKAGHERVKSPARTWKDRSGDCKSFSILIASILQNLGIKYKYRFAAYDVAQNISHVYVIATIDGQEIILDAVHSRFDEEVFYSSKKDYRGRSKAKIAGLPKKQCLMLPVIIWLGVTTLIRATQ